MLDRAALIAPGDVESLLGQAASARRKLAAHAQAPPRLQRQLDIALRMLGDHAARRCPQIPYHTVALLAAAVLYFLRPVDAVPDWLPRVGLSDDALIFELAFELGQAGVERYCAWKEISGDGLLARRKRRVRPH